MAGLRELGEMREAGLGRGVVRYREAGEGLPVVFVHGFLVNGELWRKVVPALAERYRCVVLELPFGSHAVPMGAGVDLRPPGMARLDSGFLEALDLCEVTLVGNDTGGAICQLVVAGGAGRVSRLVLTNCDAFENFPPPLRWGAYVPGFVALLARALQRRLVWRALFATVARSVPEKEVLDAYLGPIARAAGVRRDVARVLRGVSGRYTIEAARSFAGFRGAVVLVWGEDDFLFPLRFAKRLRDAFPDARLERVAGSRTFVPEDRPERLAELIDSFLEVGASAG